MRPKRAASAARRRSGYAAPIRIRSPRGASRCGVRVNDPGSAPATSIFRRCCSRTVERIEIGRGPQSALWGSDAIGGVVNIITREGEGPLGMRASVEGGSFGYRTRWRRTVFRNGEAELSLSGSYLYTDGFSRVDEDLGASEKDGTRAFTVTGKAGFRSATTTRSRLPARSRAPTAETDPSLTN